MPVLVRPIGTARCWPQMWCLSTPLSASCPGCWPPWGVVPLSTPTPS